MRIVLHPKAAPKDRIRIWIGAFQTTSPPALRWFLDDTETVPMALREIRSVRPNEMLPQGADPANVSRVFTGVYEFSGLRPDTTHRIAVEANGVWGSIEARTMLDEVPASLQGTFNVLIVSCFHQREDPVGLAGVIVSQLKSTSKPHLSILMGDQVYLDLPTLKDFKDDVRWLANKFEADYTTNWQLPPGYSQVLSAAPSVAIPDDHEFWNNYPHVSPFIGNSHDQAGRDRWRAAAIAMYEGFQLAHPAKVGEATVIDVDPLSFFLPDTRTLRDKDRRFVMDDNAHRRMEEWVRDVIRDGKFGVIVTGQSLFTKPAGGFSGKVGDYEMPNYADYGRIMKQLEKLADAGLPAICVTGDVHFGRVVEAVDIRTRRAAFYEIISSPSSLVSTVGADQFREVRGWLGGLFGKRDPWPRHSDAPNAPEFLASEILGGRFQCATRHTQKGNNVAMLKFARHGTGIEVRVTYWPISQDNKIGKPQEAGPFLLNRA